MDLSAQIARLETLNDELGSAIEKMKFTLITKKEPANPINNQPVVLIIGHSKESGGAFNQTRQIDEYDFNSYLVGKVKSELLSRTFERKIIIQERQKLTDLPGQINAVNPLFAISFHANAFNTKATGTEMLYHRASLLSKAFAEITQQEVVKALNLKDRGIKPKGREDRGGYLLKGVECPIIIAEPFFIDNDNDFDIVERNYTELVKAFANAICRFDEIMEYENGKG
jgi:N-acetylmuramoyl-L-alanine amidase